MDIEQHLGTRPGPSQRINSSTLTVDFQSGDPRLVGSNGALYWQVVDTIRRIVEVRGDHPKAVALLAEATEALKVPPELPEPAVDHPVGVAVSSSPEPEPEPEPEETEEVEA